MDPRVIVKEEDEVFCCDDPEYPLINTADHSLNDRTRASDIVTLKVDPNTMCIKVEPCIADHEFKTEFSDTELKEELLPPNIEQAEVKTDEIFESLSDCEKEEEHDSMDKKQPSPTSTNSKQARKHQSDSRKTLNNTQFYICHECGHKSKQKTALKLHMLTHMDPAHVTWYKCELCPYASKLKGGLNVHMLSHKTITEECTNIAPVEKPRCWNKFYLCPVCFTTVGHFTRHIFRKHPDDETVREISSMPLNSKERRAAIVEFRKKGQLICHEQNNGTKPKEINEVEYVPCVTCSGYCKKRYLWRHRKICNGRNLAEDNGSVGNENYFTETEIFMAKTDLLDNNIQ